MEKISPSVRILAIVVLLAGLAGVLALRTMGPSGDPAEIAVPVTPAKDPATQPTKPVKTQAPPVAATGPPAVNAPRPEAPPSGFPAVVDRALRQHEVLVVSLVVPGAHIDELAASEARAGAKLGGVGYLALNVLSEEVAHALLTKLERVQDPSVLVLNRSGEIVLELTGFVDRETVAQAAAAASS